MIETLHLHPEDLFNRMSLESKFEWFCIFRFNTQIPLVNKQHS